MRVADRSTAASLSATEAVNLIRRGELRAFDYATQLIRHCRSLQSLRAILSIDEPGILAAASAVDERLNQGEDVGPLGGVAIVAKDNIDLAGAITAAGTEFLSANLRRSTAPVLQRLLEHGAIFFAKSNMHELAAGGSSNNPVTGSVANPYDRTRVAGGSSGGTAAAIAAGIVPGGLGTDTAGSVRVPSALCGVVGLRPSTGAGRSYPTAGVLPLATGLDIVGPIARTARDIALLHMAITGEPIRGTPEVDTLRIGIPHKPYWEGLDPQVLRVAEQALRRLETGGATLVEVDVSGYFARATEVHATLFTAGLKESLRVYPKLAGAGFRAEDIIGAIRSPDVRALFERANRTKVTPTQLEVARGPARTGAVSAYREMFLSLDLDAIAFPTVPMVAPPISAKGDSEADELEINGMRINTGMAWMRNTRVTCVLDAPGLSMPAGLTTEGLPVGLEFDGFPGEDAALIAVGLAVEQAWPSIRGPVLSD